MSEHSNTALRVLVAAGGTGGHFYPALAVVNELESREPNAEFAFAATSRGLEGKLAAQAGFPVAKVRVQPLRGGSLWRRLKSVAVLPVAAIDAWRLLSRFRPDVVMGVGGYLSGPLLAMASLRRIPTLVVEPNVTPGLANRWLARWVDAAAVAWQETMGVFGRKAFLSGNPVRAEITRVPDVEPDDSMAILLVGGSQGARALNEAMAAALPLLEPHADRIRITHQTGPADLDVVRAAYEGSPIPARVEPYLDAMADEYAAHDLVICRAGATTCAELTAAGRAAVMVPLPAAGGHQRHNAEALMRAGAALMIEQVNLTPEYLTRTLLDLLESPQQRADMAREARALARPDAARTIVDKLLELSGHGS
jgi:UDP-N-acetylglucosamine--N-acetylmuramyl-(pentapeptide) pyrophosphoryl-undecaprenol N-acetylglucosamine transferase